MMRWVRRGIGRAVDRGEASRVRIQEGEWDDIGGGVEGGRHWEVRCGSVRSWMGKMICMNREWSGKGAL